MKRRISTVMTFLLYLVNNQLNAQIFTDFIDKVQTYQDSIKLTSGRSNDTLDSTTFNFEEYMRMFNKIKTEDNYKLGCEFFDNFLDGQPYIYALKDSNSLYNTIKQEALKIIRVDTLYKTRLKIVHHGLFKFLNDTTKEVKEFEIRYDEKQFEEAYHHKLYKFLNDSSNRAYNHIIPEDSEIGYIQYLFFCKFGEMFALKWHSNYGNKSIITSKRDISEIIKFYTNNEWYVTNKNEMKSLLKLHLSPTIQLNLNECSIIWYEIEERYGIYKRTYRINRKQPYTITLTENKKLTSIGANFMY
jgi:hypothetical protein